MENEVEVVAAASAGSLVGATRHPVQPGLPCANCGEVVEQRYCTGCGQLASDFHRPIWNLIGSGLADTFALDGRLARTLPGLLLRPGRVTRNYLDGQRARYVPPFRLFLLSSILFFLALFTLGERLGWYNDWKVDLGAYSDLNVSISEDQRIKLINRETLKSLQETVADEDATDEDKSAAADKLEKYADAIVLEDILNKDGTFNRDGLREELSARVPEDVTTDQLNGALSEINRFVDVYENQDAVTEGVKTWMPRFSVLFLPIFSLFVAMLYFWRRRFFLYDHLVTGLHFQTFLYLMGASFIVLGAVAQPLVGTLWLAAFVLPIIYLYRMLRVTYGTGHILSGLRAFVLYLLSLLALLMLVILMVVYVVLGIS